MPTTTPIRLELPKITFTPLIAGVPDTPNEVAIECMASQLFLGAEIDEESETFCTNGVGEAFVELSIKASTAFWDFMEDNANTYVQAEVIVHREKTSPADDNRVYLGNVWVPVLTTVINADKRGYTTETFRFESRGESWTVDKGAGAVAIGGWR